MSGIGGTSRPAAAGLLTGKVVLVCGIGPGLGRSLAVRSAQAGADVVLAARTEPRLREVADEVVALGRSALAVPTDVTDESSVSNLVERATETFGRVDALLNSAFVQPPQERLLDTDLDAIRRWNDINVLASVGLIQKLAPALTEVSGAVVLINSMVIRNRLPGFGAYRMNKAALLAAARSLSVELGPLGVRVNSVAPGYIWAEKVRGHFRRLADRRGVSEQQVYDEITAKVDLRRLPTPDEIADAAVFLASDMASGITGQCLDVTCGETHH
ncbi:SDR family oxidoreductase [Sphaerimonospora thailandensis]|uniref:Putative Short-chain dehydrogenase/reductase n=1 Tax=Sphaerimonospora thailandensis TaxID=795644 RepID=A0A8J3R578_9ACTN|nr:SDR family oxidoreductase [Sphaerimonospora thailandensis]GIH68061.1 putative Short-chain dehydrogenase/reductase [Sphaerimonospora thailandensis]